jgi:hypothetical protein
MEAIIEVLLYSKGFHSGSRISKMLALVMMDATIQLKMDKHYDFGVRTAKLIIDIACKSRVLEKNSAHEEVLMIINAVNVIMNSRFDDAEKHTYNSIMTSCFRENADAPINIGGNSVLIDGLKLATSELKLQSTTNLLESCVDVYNLYRASSGIILLGGSGTGKSASLRTLINTIVSSKSEFKDFHEITYHSLYPNALSTNELFGSLSPNQEEWVNGILPAILINFHSQPENEGTSKQLWISFDGELKPHWVENLNSVLDDSRKFTLSNGETICISSRVKIFFEVDSLKDASPAVVSRCGIKYFKDDHVTWRVSFYLYLS